MKPGRLAVLLLVYVAFASLPACAEVFTGDVHTTVTVLDTQYWSGINVGDGQTVEYTVKVQSGDTVNVHLMDDSQLYLFLAGSTVPTVHSNEDTTSASYTHSSAGKYALVIDNGFGTSVCKVDIVVRSAGFWETGTGCMVLVVVGVIIVVAVIVAVVVVVRRRRPAVPRPQPMPPQFGTPAPQYGASGYAQAPQHQQQAPPQYPAGPQYQPGPAQYPAQAPAGYPARYTPPPAPPQMGVPPAGTPQPPAAPTMPGAPAQMAQCKYCDFQMPAGTQICPRCGGFN
jgi:hypothetical protein